MVEFSLCQVNAPSYPLRVFCSRCDPSLELQQGWAGTPAAGEPGLTIYSPRGCKGMEFSPSEQFCCNQQEVGSAKSDDMNEVIYSPSQTWSSSLNTDCWAPPPEFLNGLVGWGPRTGISHRFWANADAALEWVSVQRKATTCGSRLRQRNTLHGHPNSLSGDPTVLVKSDQSLLSQHFQGKGVIL